MLRQHLNQISNQHNFMPLICDVIYACQDLQHQLQNCCYQWNKGIKTWVKYSNWIWYHIMLINSSILVLFFVSVFRQQWFLTSIDYVKVNYANNAINSCENDDLSCCKLSDYMACFGATHTETSLTEHVFMKFSTFIILPVMCLRAIVCVHRT